MVLILDVTCGLVMWRRWVSGFLHAAAVTAARVTAGWQLPAAAASALSPASAAALAAVNWCSCSGLTGQTGSGGAQLSVVCCSAAVTRHICSEQQQWVWGHITEDNHHTWPRGQNPTSGEWRPSSCGEAGHWRLCCTGLCLSLQSEV